MQHPWWFHVRDLARHVLGNSLLFVVTTSLFVFDSALLEFAGRLIHSKFVFHSLVVLEYAFLVSDTVVIGMFVIENMLNSLKRVRR
jgi:hypothetical protein